MIPYGYMAKNIVKRPEWLKDSRIDQVLSVSSCMSKDFADYVEFWRHNGFWMFDSPESIFALAVEHKISMSGLRWFYYEAYEKEYDADSRTWCDFHPEPSFTTQVIQPTKKILKGYDIVTNTFGQMVECSPISCNSLAEDIDVNSDCLIRDFDDVFRYISESGMAGCEPGPYRIVAVYEVDLPKTQ